MPTIDLMELDSKSFSELWAEVESLMIDSDDCSLSDEELIFADM